MSTPIPTAGRNVAWRIEQLLRAQEAMPTLTNWQAETVMAATTAVDEERFADGEADMMKAERPDLWQGARLRAGYQSGGRAVSRIAEKRGCNVRG